MRLRIGLLAADSRQLGKLSQLVQGCGYDCVEQLLLQSGCIAEVHVSQTEHASQTQQADKAVQAWVVSLANEFDDTASNEDELPTLLNEWLERQQVPVIVDQPEADSRSWQRRLRDKLQALPAYVGLEAGLEQQPLPQHIWLLGASTGGPAAVKAFLQSLPVGLPVAFVYVQHIDDQYAASLEEMITRHSAYPAYVVKAGDMLAQGKTAVVTGYQWLEVMPNGVWRHKTLAPSDEGANNEGANAEPSTHDVAGADLSDPNGRWPGRYQPSIDQVFATMASHFGPRCGAIVFSGMGDDGAVGCRLIQQHGGQVWAQSLASCTIDSMPESVLTSGLVSQVAAPEQLARLLVQWLQTHDKTNNR